MKEKIEVRKATTADVLRIIELWKALEAYHAKPQSHGKGVFKDMFKYKSNRLALYIKYLKKQLHQRNAAVFVAEFGGRVAGHVMVEVQKLPPILVYDKNAFVCEIVVDERYRGKGIGTALLKETETWAKKKGMYSIALTVHTDNKNAYSVYRKSGFREHHLRMAKIVK